MTPETRVQIFDAFFTTKAPADGTGLGLHTVAHIMADSGGQIDVSTELDRGTRFTLRWPLARAPEKLQPAKVAPRTRRHGLILVAEDNRGVRKALALGLANAGYRVVVAVDGNDALQKLAMRDDWDALCTDAVMPGYESERLIADFQARFPHRPVVLCSGYLPGGLSENLGKLKVRFLAKPFAPSALVTLLDSEFSRVDRPH